ncbi:hypothetical protein AHAS_Ahas09G0070400 [Arachis hypogaea]
MKDKVGLLEGKEVLLETKKIELEGRIAELCLKKKTMEESKGTHGLKMFAEEFERASDQAKFIASTVDFAMMARARG